MRELGRCGFPIALAYFVTGEQAIFNELISANTLWTPKVTDAKALWRFLAQREMQAQCDGCTKICAIVSHFDDAVYPPEKEAGHNKSAKYAQYPVTDAQPNCAT